MGPGTYFDVAVVGLYADSVYGAQVLLRHSGGTLAWKFFAGSGTPVDMMMAIATAELTTATLVELHFDSSDNLDSIKLFA